jgi:cellulose synthase (UDP-forming)
MTDPRIAPATWTPTASRAAVRRARWLAILGTLAAAVYLRWLLQPGRVGHPVLYTILVVAELFNVAQALGFWWTCSRRRRRKDAALPRDRPAVDVFVPVYGEPVEIVEPVIAAATRLRGVEARVALLDDGDSPAMEAMARRHGVAYLRRTVHQGAKAGNVNHALGRTSAPYVAVFDADHVPDPAFCERTIGHLTDPEVAFVQTPQYYANHAANGVARAAWAQQALFFGPIAEGKDAAGAMFCCGTNVVFNRTALEAAGGFPEGSLTEDFELSLRLQEQGWRTVYVPEVLAHGLGPEDMASYVSQQHRWARGCLSALPRILRARLPWRLRIQYLLASGYFLTGWTAIAYLMFPVVRILTGEQPVAGASADQFLLVFGPYFGLALAALAATGSGRYTFDAYALAFANAWIHVHATLRALFRRPGRFVVTPKQGSTARQPGAVLPGLLAIAALLGVAGYGLSVDRSPSTLNNVAFAALHVTVLVAGVAPALSGRRAESAAAVERADEEVRAA